ncbi:MAG: hypothetical protein RML40_08240 [Bacteroidota bacterium]|nr:hypothetical protein [Candidatus Kapabacteria bacterium]MDW8220504.1 hypothetical protein [Bacteroidota bacterium]
MFFPVGRESTYLPVTLTEATTGTTAPYVGVKPYLGPAGGTPDVGVMGALSISEFWRIERVSGDFVGARVGVLRSSLTAAHRLTFSPIRTGVYTILVMY